MRRLEQRIATLEQVVIMGQRFFVGHDGIYHEAGQTNGPHLTVEQISELERHGWEYTVIQVMRTPAAQDARHGAFRGGPVGFPHKTASASCAFL